MVLPVKYPIASTYPFIGNPLAILLSHEETYPWLMNNFIQIRGITLEGYLSIYIDYNDFDYKNCPFLDIQRISKDIIADKWDSILEFIREAIDNDSYVYMLVKMRCISAYGIEDEENENVHDILIYGYCDETNELAIADNFGGTYTFKKCSYGEFLSAVKAIRPEEEIYNEFYKGIILIKYRYDKKISINPVRIRESIEDYLNGTPTKEWYLRQYEPWMETREFIFYYGVENYKSMDKIIDSISRTKQFPNATRQPVHLMMQHKKIMYLRYKYMYENGYTKNDRLLSDIKTLSDEAGTFLNLLLKHLVSEEDMADIIVSKYRGIKDMEQKCLLEFAADLI